MTQVTKNKIVLYVFLAAMIAVFFLPVQSPWLKMGMIAAIMLVFLFMRRSSILFVMGARRLQKKDQRCWKLFKKAIDANLSPDQAVYVATAFIKQGDCDYGMKTAQRIADKHPDSEAGKSAAITLSMGFWVKGELGKAISTLEELRQKGYANSTLDINLTTYLLESGEADRAMELLRQNEESGTLTNGLLDNKLWALILKGRYAECGPIVTELMDERKPRFPEAYLHSAQVMIHEGRIEKAIEYLDKGCMQQFSANGAMGKSFLEKLSAGLGDSGSRLAYAFAIDSNPALIAQGKEIEIDLSKGGDFKEVSESSLPKPGKRTSQPRGSAKGKKHGRPDDDMDDDREPNTDLNEDDFAGLEAYSELDDESDETEPDENLPNTDVSDEDEREPDTSVD